MIRRYQQAGGSENQRRFFPTEPRAKTNAHGFGFISRTHIADIAVLSEHFIGLDELGVRHSGGKVYSRILESLDHQLCFFRFHSVLHTLLFDAIVKEVYQLSDFWSPLQSGHDMGVSLWFYCPGHVFTRRPPALILHHDFAGFL